MLDICHGGVAWLCSIVATRGLAFSLFWRHTCWFGRRRITNFFSCIGGTGFSFWGPKMFWNVHGFTTWYYGIPNLYLSALSAQVSIHSLKKKKFRFSFKFPLNPWSDFNVNISGHNFWGDDNVSCFSISHFWSTFFVTTHWWLIGQHLWDCWYPSSSLKWVSKRFSSLHSTNNVQNTLCK